MMAHVLFGKESKVIHNYSESKHETQQVWGVDERQILLVIKEMHHAIP